jgi:hypothetical protein
VGDFSPPVIEEVGRGGGGSTGGEGAAATVSGGRAMDEAGGVGAEG